MIRLQKWLPDILARRSEEMPSLEMLTGTVSQAADMTHYARALPGQNLDNANFLFAPGGNYDVPKFLASYAISTWVQMAVSKLASSAPSGDLRIFERANPSVDVPDHPLLGLLGRYGQPNDSQDQLEFIELLIIFLELAGNSYLYWWSETGGPPTQVFLLEPEKVNVVPGTQRTVDGYIYRHMGHEFRLSHWQVSHLRRGNPGSRYYGLSPMQALMPEVTADLNMLGWNIDFFGPNVSTPAGILIVPAETSPTQIKKMEDELAGRFGSERRTMIVRSELGQAAWFDAGLKHRELEFLEGRLLSRQAVMNVLDVPLGVYSEMSTEAHARVAARQLWASVMRRLGRVAAKLQADALQFWPGHLAYGVGYLDTAQTFADWEQEKLKIETLSMIFGVDEIRATYFNRGPLVGQVAAGLLKGGTDDGRAGVVADEGAGDA